MDSAIQPFEQLGPGLSSPGKCQNKIPGLSRISRTPTNPVSMAASVEVELN